MNTNKISLEELLQIQYENGFLATIEVIVDEKDKVKVTPWASDAGCLCSYALNIEKELIETVQVTGKRHYCCNNALIVVQINFKENAAISLSNLFTAFMTNIKKKPTNANEQYGKVDDLLYSNSSSFESPDSYNYTKYQSLLGQSNYLSNLICPRGQFPLSCNGGRPICVQQGSSCCGYRICPPGKVCRAVPGGFICV